MKPLWAGFLVLTLLLLPALASTQTCSTNADTDCDGTVNITELNAHIDAWYMCSACVPDLFQAIQAYYSIPFCGDLVCNGNETCSDCPEDCGECAEPCAGVTGCGNYTIQAECEDNNCSINGGCEWNGSNCFEVPAGNFYYVRSNATGANNGSDWTNAYTDLPDSLERGATYYIADGNYSGGYLFDDAQDGETYIYIRKATGSYHGTNTGWNSSYGDGQAFFSFANRDQRWLFTAPYYDINGVTGGGPDNWDGSVTAFGFVLKTAADMDFTGGYRGFVRFGGSSYCTPDISHVKLQHIEFKTEQREHETGQYGIYQAILKAHNPDSLLCGASDILVSYCYMHNLSRHIDFTYANSWTIEYSYFTENDVYPYGSNQGTSLQILAHSDNVIIRYNIFENIDGTAVIDLKADNTQTNFDNWSIYGNVFYVQQGFPEGSDWDEHGGMGNGVIRNGGVQGETITSNMKVYNNAFINILSPWHNGVTAAGGIVWPNGEGHNNVAYNNLWYQPGEESQAEHSTMIKHKNAGANYNMYISCLFRTGDPGGFDDCPAPNDVNEVYGSNPFADWPNMDFRLAEATEAGLTLPAPYNKDWYGNIRGADGNWDRGAIEYVEGPECSTATDCSDKECNTKDCIGESCVYTPVSDGTPCTDDGLYCTGTETCQSGQCVSSGNPCQTGEICNETADSCDIDPCFGINLCSDYNDETNCTTNPCNIENCQWNISLGVCEEIPVTLPQGYVSYWKFDEAIGVITPDETGVNNGTLMGDAAIVSDAERGNVLGLDGDEDYVYLSSFNGNISDEGTVTFWFNSKSITLYNGLIVSSSLNPSIIEFASNTIRADVWNTSGRSGMALYSSTLDNDDWYHIAVTYNSTIGILYINGTEDYTDTSVFPPYATPTTLYIGSDRNIAGRYFNGLIDEVMIYNRSLSSTEIQQIYNSQK